MEDGGGKREYSVPSEPRGDDPPSEADPPAPIDVAKSIFYGGVNMLKRQGFTDVRACSTVGKWRKTERSDGILLSCPARAKVERPQDLVARMTSAITTDTVTSPA